MAKGSIYNIYKVYYRVREESIYKESSFLCVSIYYQGTFDSTSKVWHSKQFSLLVAIEPSLLYKLL
jgi:hypothetical protein